MRRMFSEKQIKEMISAGAQSEIAEALEGDISIGGDLSVAGDSSVTGDQSVGGDLSVTGDIAGAEITGDSIIENMSGYSASLNPSGVTDHEITNIYSGCVKNGNKITFVTFLKVNRATGATNNRVALCRFSIPSSIGNKLYPYSISGYTNMLDISKGVAVAGITSNKDIILFVTKGNETTIDLSAILDPLTAETDYLIRIEKTFLLSDNLVSE